MTGKSTKSPKSEEVPEVQPTSIFRQTTDLDRIPMADPERIRTSHSGAVRSVAQPTNTGMRLHSVSYHHSSHFAKVVRKLSVSQLSSALLVMSGMCCHVGLTQRARQRARHSTLDDYRDTFGEIIALSAVTIVLSFMVSTMES